MSWTRTKTKVAFSAIVSLACVLAYWQAWIFRHDYRKIQFSAIATEELNVNERVTRDKFYNRIDTVFKKEYVYYNPDGKFATKNIKFHEPLNLSNTSFQKSPSTVVSFVSIPIHISVGKGMLTPGDEIALSINGRIFPKTRDDGFTVMEVSSQTDSPKIQVLLKVSNRQFTDSLWYKNASDYIVPIILKRAERHKSSGGLKPCK